MRPDNRHRQIKLPSSINEYYVLNATDRPYVFEMFCFNMDDEAHLSAVMQRMDELSYENLENASEVSSDRIQMLMDPGASLEERARFVKIRKVDRSIIDNLKYIYDYRCQISGEKIGKEFGRCVIEAHHIEYFTRSQNNDASNIIIISPNYHRIIHQNNPHFNFETKSFDFDNGVKLNLKLNWHL